MKWYVEQFYCFGLEKLNILNYILSFIFKRKKENNITRKAAPLMKETQSTAGLLRFVTETATTASPSADQEEQLRREEQSAGIQEQPDAESE
jgi:hypothetical protein